MHELSDAVAHIAVDLSPEQSAGEDIMHFTCCDPSYYLATDRPVYAFCGHKLEPGEAIRLELGDARLCDLCLEQAQSLSPDADACQALCPRLLLG